MRFCLDLCRQKDPGMKVLGKVIGRSKRDGMLKRRRSEIASGRKGSFIRPRYWLIGDESEARWPTEGKRGYI